VGLPAKTETEQDRVPLDKMIAAMEDIRTALKHFRKRERVKASNDLRKRSKALRRSIKALQAEADGLLRSWVRNVEEAGYVFFCFRAQERF
jgi:hypothetical protein